MSMRVGIIRALEESAEPLTSAEIVKHVRENGRVGWKASSITNALTALVTQGRVRNLDRDPETGTYRQTPCRYEAVTS